MRKCLVCGIEDGELGQEVAGDVEGSVAPTHRDLLCDPCFFWATWLLAPKFCEFWTRWPLYMALGL